MQTTRVVLSPREREEMRFHANQMDRIRSSAHQRAQTSAWIRGLSETEREALRAEFDRLVPDPADIDRVIEVVDAITTPAGLTIAKLHAADKSGA